MKRALFGHILRLLTWLWCIHAVGGSAAPEGADTSGAKTQWFRLSGNVQATSEFVRRSSSSAYLQPTTYHNERLMLSATVTLFDQVQLPFHLYLGNGLVAYDQPFNQFGASLRLTRWLTLHGGFFSYSMSRLTFGDLRLEGGGVELSPGKFRMALFYGRGRRAQAPDSTRYFGGIYERWYWGWQIGYDNRKGLRALLSVMKAKDDTTSLVCTTPLCPKPQENLVSSITVSVPLGRQLRFTSEGAVSAISRDLYADVVPDVVPSAVAAYLFAPRLSSAVDIAAQNRLILTPSPYWSVSLNADWIGPGYATLGYIHLLSDIMRFTISPTVQLMKGKISMSGSLGLEKDNVAHTRLETTRRIIGSVSAMAMVTPKITVTTSYSNYGLRSYIQQDTPRSRIITQNFTLAPQVRSSLWGLRHLTMLSYAFSDMQDINLVSGWTSAFRGHSINLTHSIRKPRRWNTSSSLFWFFNKAQPGGPTASYGVSQSFGIPLFERKMRLSATAGYTQQSNDFGKSQTLSTSISASYRLKKWGTFSLRGSYRHTQGGFYGTQPVTDFRGTFTYTMFFK